MPGGSSLSSEPTQAFIMYVLHKLNKNTCAFSQGKDTFRGESDKARQERVIFYTKKQKEVYIYV